MPWYNATCHMMYINELLSHVMSPHWQVKLNDTGARVSKLMPVMAINLPSPPIPSSTHTHTMSTKPPYPPTHTHTHTSPLSLPLSLSLPRWPSGKASASRAEDPGFESRLRRDFFGGQVIPVTQKLALQWLPCQAPGVIGSELGLVGPVSVCVTGWGRKFDLQLLSQCGSTKSCLSRSVPEIHWHVAGTLSNQQTLSLCYTHTQTGAGN